jgi:peptide/nickel transport system substrate-binding protein
VFLYVPYSLPAVSSRIHGIRPAPAGIAYNLDKWYVPEGLQKYSVVP